ncbi:restriction endonuclease subunit S [Acinetobacter baumannii]
MSDWKQCLLGSIAEVQTGPFGSQLKNEQYITGGTPVITVEHINAFRIQNIDYPSVTEDDRQRLARYSLNAGDIVFTRVGSVDLSAYVKPENQGWLFSSRMLRVRVSTVEVDSLFLSYFFRQEKFREYILNIAVGATMPSINTQILKDIPISYPPLPEQKAIASVLSSLDDKIDLLHRQNKTLEAMAETLFRQWFIEEAKEDWEVTPLSRIFDFLEGPGIRNWQYVENGVNFINIRLIDVGEVNVNSANKISEEEGHCCK